MKISKITSALCATSFFFFGCLTGDDSSGSGSTDAVVKPGSTPTKIQFSIVDEDTYTVDDSTITRQRMRKNCDEGGVFEERMSVDIQYYKIEEGTLYVWWEGDSCYAQTYTGGGTKLEGTKWLELGEGPLPGVESCTNHDDDYESTVKEHVSWSGGKRTHHYSGSYCWAEDYTEGEEGVVAKGCNVVESSLENGKVATVTLLELNAETGSRKEKTSYDGKECVLNLPGFDANWLNAASCQEAWKSFTESDSYNPDGYNSFYADEWVKTERRQAREAYGLCKSQIGLPEFH